MSGSQGRHEDPQLGGRPQQERDGPPQEGTEIGEDSHTQEDEGRKQLGLYSLVVDQGDDAAAIGTHVGQGEVGQEGSEADGDEQQGLVFLGYRQVNQDPAHQKHHPISPGQMSEPGLLEESGQYVHVGRLSRWSEGAGWSLSRHRWPHARQPSDRGSNPRSATTPTNPDFP